MQEGVVNNIVFPNITNKLVVYLFFIVVAIDFKGSEGVGIYQAFIFFLAIFFFILYAYRTERAIFSSSLFFSLFIIYLLGSIFVAVQNDVPYKRIVSVSIPYFIFVMAYLLADIACREGNIINVFRAIVLSGVISVFFNFLRSYYNFGQDIISARYAILSPVSILMYSFFLYAYYMRFFNKYLSISMVFIIILFSVISQTRSVMLGLVIMTLIIGFMLGKSGLRRQSNLIFIIISISAVALLFFMLDIFEGELANALYNRFFLFKNELGFDVTTITRLAEAQNQLNQILIDCKSLLFGKGLGASYSYDSSYYYMILDSGAFSRDFLDSLDDFQGGHNFWIFTIFSGGILFGLPLVIAMILISLKVALLYFVNNNRLAAMDDVEKLILSIGLIGSVTFFLQSIGGTPMGSRYSALVYGSLWSIAYRASKLKTNKF